MPKLVEPTFKTEFRMEIYRAAARILAANVAQLGVDNASSDASVEKAVSLAVKLMDKANELVV